MVGFGKKWKSDHLSKNDGNKKILILHNDNINSFDYVIDSLCEVCEHDNVQAEQCAFLTHFRGSCSIKSGKIEELAKLKTVLAKRNLTVTIE